MKKATKPLPAQKQGPCDISEYKYPKPRWDADYMCLQALKKKALESEQNQRQSPLETSQK